MPPKFEQVERKYKRSERTQFGANMFLKVT